MTNDTPNAYPMSHAGQLFDIVPGKCETVELTNLSILSWMECILGVVAAVGGNRGFPTNGWRGFVLQELQSCPKQTTDD